MMRFEHRHDPLRVVVAGGGVEADRSVSLPLLADPDRTSTFSEQPLWWPPTKIASRWQSPYLARLAAEHLAPA